MLWRPHGRTLQLYVAFAATRGSLWTGFWDFPRAPADTAGAQDAAAVGHHPTPGFAPHRRGTTVWAKQVPQRHPGAAEGGRWHSPEELCEGHRAGTLVLSPHVWPVAQALAQSLAGGADAREAVAELVAHAARRGTGAADVYPLAPGIALVPLRTPTLPPATHTNCYLLGERSMTLVDPGSPYEDEQQALLQLLQQRVAQGARIEAIWLSHFHDDHTGAALGLHTLFGAPICAHADSAQALTGRTPVHRLLHDTEALRADGMAFEALHTPGHAHGHLCFWAQDGGHLLSGDNVLGTGTPIVPPSPHGSLQAYLQSLHHMAARPLGLLLPGHGPPCPSAAARLQETQLARTAREALLLSTLSALPEGASLQALCHRLYRGLAASLLGLAELSTRSHLEKLCAEHKVLRTGPDDSVRYTLAAAQKDS